MKKRLFASLALVIVLLLVLSGTGMAQAVIVRMQSLLLEHDLIVLGDSTISGSNTVGGAETVGTTLTVGTGLTVTSGGQTITAGGQTITAGGQTITAGGQTITAGGSTIGGLLKLTAATSVTVTNGAAFAISGAWQPITAAGNVTPTITIPAIGTQACVINTSNTSIVIQDTSNQVLGADRTLGQYDVLCGHSDGTRFIETGFYNN